MTALATNLLSYGDNLDILRRYQPAAAVDLVELDPPFNSNPRRQRHLPRRVGLEHDGLNDGHLDGCATVHHAIDDQVRPSRHIADVPVPPGPRWREESQLTVPGRIVLEATQGLFQRLPTFPS
jgi:hypothetical protein